MLRKLAIKFLTMLVTVTVMGGAMRFARPYLFKAAGVPEGMPGTESLENAHFSSEESDLMGTVFRSAIKLFTGQASRAELANELSEKLYANRGDAATMSELGIELQKPGQGASPLDGLGADGKSPAMPVVLTNIGVPGASASSVPTPAQAVGDSNPTVSNEPDDNFTNSLANRSSVRCKSSRRR